MQAMAAAGCRSKVPAATLSTARAVRYNPAPHAPPRPETSPPVHQSGPRSLWNALDGLRADWLRDGSLPAYGANVTISPDGSLHFQRGRWQARIPADS
jgi:hypothetical protein